MGMDYEQVGRRLREARRAQGLTQEELVRIAGVSQAALSTVENGGRRVRGPSAMEMVADALGLRVDLVVVPADADPPRLLHAVEALDEDQRAAASAILEVLHAVDPSDLPLIVGVARRLAKLDRQGEDAA